MPLMPPMDQFGYAQPLTPEQLAMQQQNQQALATQQLKKDRLQEQMLRAQQLRGQSNPQNLSPLSAIGDAINQHAGRRDSFNLRGQQEQNEQGLSKSMAAQGAHAQMMQQRGETNALAGARQARQQHLESLAQRERASMRSAAGRGRTPENKKPVRNFLVGGGEFLGDWSEADNAYKDIDGKLHTADKVIQHGDVDIIASERKEWVRAPKRIERIFNYAEMSDEVAQELTQPLGVPTETLNKFIQSGDSTGIVEAAVKNMSWLDRRDKAKVEEVRAKVRRQITVLNDFRLNFVMPYRELMTSGVLSNQDVNEYNSAINIHPGMDWKTFKQSIGNLAGTMEGNLRSQYAMYQEAGTKSTYIMAKSIYGPFFDDTESKYGPVPPLTEPIGTTNTPDPMESQEAKDATALLKHPLATPEDRKIAQETLDELSR